MTLNIFFPLSDHGTLLLNGFNGCSVLQLTSRPCINGLPWVSPLMALLQSSKPSFSSMNIPTSFHYEFCIFFCSPLWNHSTQIPPAISDNPSFANLFSLGQSFLKPQTSLVLPIIHFYITLYLPFVAHNKITFSKTIKYIAALIHLKLNENRGHLYLIHYYIFMN